MTTTSAQEHLLAFVTPYVRPATLWAPKKTEHPTDICSAKLRGTPYSEAAQPWPKCNTCQEQLEFVGQLPGQHGALATLFYCMECSPWGEETEGHGQWQIQWYPNANAERYQPLVTTEETPQFDEVALEPRAMTLLPDWEGSAHVLSNEHAWEKWCEQLNPLTPWEAWETIGQLAGTRSINEGGTWTGGYPLHIQSYIEKKCPHCDEPMRFFGQIDSEDDAELMWGDSGILYLFQCLNHPETFAIEMQCC